MNRAFIDRPRWYDGPYRWWILLLVVLFVLNGFRLAYKEFHALPTGGAVQEHSR